MRLRGLNVSSLLCAVVVTACGPEDKTEPVVPSGLMYSSPDAKYIVNKEISPNVPILAGGTVESFSISGGALPVGIKFDLSGTFGGTPTVLQERTAYTVTAKGPSGSTSTTLFMTVYDPPVLSYERSVGSGTLSNAYVGAVGQPLSISPLTFNLKGQTLVGCALKTTTPAQSLPAGITLDAATCVLSGTPLSVAVEKEYKIILTTAVGPSDDAKVKLSVGADVPTLTYAGAAGTVGTNGSPMLVIAATDARGAPIAACGIKTGSPALPAGLTVSSTSCNISGTPTQNSPATSYTIVAKNSVGDSADATVTLTVNAGVPTLRYATGTNAGSVGSSLSVTPSTLVANGASITACGAKTGSTALPAGLSVDAVTCVISGAPTSTSSSTTYTLVATNSVGASADATVTIAVNAGRPSLTYPSGTQTAQVNTAVTINPSLSTNGSNLTACGTKSGTLALPAGLSVNPATCAISGTPSATSGPTTYTIVATNSAGTSTDAPVTIEVVARVPTLAYGAGTNTGTVNATMTINPSALVDNGSTITDCKVKPTTAALPAGLTVDPGTCVIAGTPTTATATATYTLIATNGMGDSADAPVTIEINN